MKDNALYLEVDEDITSAIDKLRKLNGSSVQIVVPKRSTLLQSVINQKLLKKAANDSGKELVLVTNDRVAIDLASRVGLAVAPTLGAKGVMTESKAPAPILADDVIEDNDEDVSPISKKSEAAKSKPSQSTKAAAAAPIVTQRELSDDEPVEAPAANDQPKVPNFSKLQKRMIWLGAAAFLVAGYLVGMYFLTTAEMTLYANGSTVNVESNVTVDPALTESSLEKEVLAGQAVSVTNELSGSVVPTGKKDVGTKASGTMTIKNEYDAEPHPLQEGTRFVAPDGKIFRTTSDVTVPGATATVVKGQPVLAAGSTQVAVVADQAGDTYNEAPNQRYNIPGLPAEQQTQIYGIGSQMSGGTSKTVTIVTQADVDKARNAVLAKDKSAGKEELAAKTASGYLLLDSSITSSPEDVAVNPAVGEQADTATITMKAVHKGLTVKRDDYIALIRQQEQKQLGEENQIYEDGIDKAIITAQPPAAGGKQEFLVKTTAFGGAKIDKNKITKELQGKRFGDAADYVTDLPGVERADIVLWPVWATSLPRIQNNIDLKITINKD